jgi:integrase
MGVADMPKRVTKDLTDVRVRNAKPTDSQYEIFDRSVGGFALRVTPSGSKSFVVNFRCNGKNRRMTLGNAAVMRLGEAREAAMVAKAKAKSGIDPMDEKRQQDEGMLREQQAEARRDERNFTAVADLYIQRYARGSGKVPNKKTWREDERVFAKYVIPRWGDRYIDDIGRADVVALLDAVEDENGLYMSNRVLATVRKLFNWALVERAMLEVTPIVPGMARKGEKKRTRVLNVNEIGSMWMATGTLGYPFGPLFRLLLATGQRRDEVASAKWSQMDLEQALWTIPSLDTKADRGDHLVPLNTVAMKIITALPRIDGSDLLFPTSSNATRPVSGFSKAKARCDQLTKSKEFSKAGMVAVSDWRLHDLRRSMATIMEDELGIAPHVIGACLNHDPQSYKGITATYTVGRLLDDRRRALDAWGQKLESILDPDVADNVVTLKKAKL